MPIDLLVEEARGMSDEKIMEVVRFVKFIKVEEEYLHGAEKSKKAPRLREAGYFKNTGKGWISEDFDESAEFAF